jgi:hypothetical protein
MHGPQCQSILPGSLGSSTIPKISEHCLPNRHRSLEVQQLHPPKRYHCLANNLEAVHRVRWVRRGDEWLALSELLAEFDRQYPQPERVPVLRLSDIG